jgi:hypothetical protein
MRGRKGREGGWRLPDLGQTGIIGFPSIPPSSHQYDDSKERGMNENLFELLKQAQLDVDLCLWVMWWPLSQQCRDTGKPISQPEPRRELEEVPPRMPPPLIPKVCALVD